MRGVTQPWYERCINVKIHKCFFDQTSGVFQRKSGSIVSIRSYQMRAAKREKCVGVSVHRCTSKLDWTRVHCFVWKASVHNKGVFAWSSGRYCLIARFKNLWSFGQLTSKCARVTIPAETAKHLRIGVLASCEGLPASCGKVSGVVRGVVGVIFG